MQTIYLDISNNGVIPTVYAKQGDVGRKFEIVLTDSGLPYIPQSGSAFSVWYSGASGEGNYTDIGGKTAFYLSGNKVTVEMICQMLSNPGNGVLCIVLNCSDGKQISSWNINYVCESVPGADSEEAKKYYTAFSKAVENLPYPDKSLSVAGKAADAAETGKQLNSKASIDYVNQMYGPNNKPTPADIGAAPAVESADHPGCYYRIVDSDTQWLNAPMILGVEYLTAQRWNGKPVYVKAVGMGTLVNNSSKRVDLGLSGVSEIVDYCVVAKNDLATMVCTYTSGVTSSFVEGLNTIVLSTSIDLSPYTGTAIVKYVK